MLRPLQSQIINHKSKMSSRVVDAELQRSKRKLRRRIGRLRRRIDGRLRSVGSGTRRLTSWRAYVTAYPGSALTAALGTGMALSAGLSGRSILRRMGLRLAGRAADRAGRRCWEELERIWADSTPERDATDRSDSPAGADDERS